MNAKEMGGIYKYLPILLVSSVSIQETWLCGKQKLHEDMTNQEKYQRNDADRLFIKNNSIKKMKQNRGIVKSLSEITEIKSQTCKILQE